MIYINQNFSQFLSLSLVGSSYTEFRVGTSTSTAIVIDWGDGSVTSYSGSLMTISHTYSSPFTGSMKISCPSGNNLITSVDNFSNSNTLNSIAFTTTQLSYFTGLETFECLESNIISGDIANLPASLLIYNNIGNNTTSGNIANLPVNLTSYGNYGSNTTTGNIANLPVNLVIYNNYGDNTTSGDIANLPANLEAYVNKGNNTTFGDISSLPSTLVVYNNYGINTTTGNINSLPINVNYYANVGNNTVVDYTPGRVWISPMKLFISLPAISGLTSTEVDNLLIDLSTPSWLTHSMVIPKKIDISGVNAARTTASDAAVALLISKGVIVTTS